MSARPSLRFCIAGAAAVLLTACIDLVSVASAIGGMRAVDEMILTLDFAWHSTMHAIIEFGPGIAGLLVGAGLIFIVVRSINHHDGLPTAKRLHSRSE